MDPLAETVTYNPDTRSKHNILDRIRIFGKTPGHKSRERDTFGSSKEPVRINERIVPSGWFTKVSTDESTTRNG